MISFVGRTSAVGEPVGRVISVVEVGRIRAGVVGGDVDSMGFADVHAVRSKMKVAMNFFMMNDYMSLRDFIKQIFPFRIQAVDQINFVLTRATFDLLFSSKCRMNVITYFVINQFMHVVFF